MSRSTLPQSQLSQIHVYPAKSLGGISLSSAWVEKQGLSFDRRFMLTTADGNMVTARKFPQLVLIKTALLADGVVFSAEGFASLTLRYASFKRQRTPAQVFNDRFEAYTTTDEADDWFSQVLRQRVELLFCGEVTNRYRAKVGHTVSFADGYPLLIISEASLDALNQRSPEQHSMAQFRPNIVVSGDEPFFEDSWKRIRIGEVEFETVKPCERCVLTTVDNEKGTFRDSQEPLKTLATFRANEAGGVFFGQNLIALNEGIIRVDDVVEVLEYKDKEQYPDQTLSSLLLTCVARETIAQDFVTFWFSPRVRFDSSVTLAPYLAGQHLPISVLINGEWHNRRYTLSSTPTRPDRYAISVKRVNGGKVSNWLLDNVQVGSEICAQSPEGRFHLPAERRSLLLLSAGSGVTPMLSMLRALADQALVDDVVFYHQCRTKNDIPCEYELQQLAREHPGLKVIIALTQPPVDWLGLRGRLSLSHIKQIKDAELRQVFVCGPDGFMQKAKNLLMKKGLPEQSYHQESFGVNHVTNTEKQTLNLTINGAAFIGDNQRTILEQSEAAGIPITNSCRSGLCGACRVRLITGQVSQPSMPALNDDLRAQGMILACCCIPQGDVEVSL